MKRFLGTLLLISLTIPSLLMAKEPLIRVRPGIDVLLADPSKLLHKKRVALVTHSAAVGANLESTVDLLAKTPGVKLVSLMGPEHGVRGDQHANEHVANTIDPKTKLPIYSLFGETTKPTVEMLQSADIIVYDLQDVGVRSYTYISTLALVMETAAELDIPIIVLDRPNPLGGVRVEGNTPTSDYKQHFVCWLPIPFVYGMTSGELAQMINGEGWLRSKKRAQLTVVPLKGWKRQMLFSETGLAWVPTSPHIPHPETPLYYAASALSIPNLFNGVGYTLPFEIMGAPFVDSETLAAKLNALKLPGIYFRPTTVKAFYSTFKDQKVDGVQIYIKDPKVASLAPISFYVAQTLNEIYPERHLFSKANGSGEWEFWETLVGDPHMRAQMENGKAFVKPMLAKWQSEIDKFLKRRQKYLLY